MKKILCILLIVAFAFTGTAQTQDKPRITKEEQQHNIVVINSVVINGVEWATCNIGKRGKFVSKPYHSGKHYIWEDAKSACPAGWRLPTKNEIESLLDVPNRWTKMNGVNGREFGTPPNTIFIPAAGYRNGRNGTLTGSGGAYWSSTAGGTGGAYILSFDYNHSKRGNSSRRYSFSVRAVAEK